MCAASLMFSKGGAFLSFTSSSRVRKGGRPAGDWKDDVSRDGAQGKEN
jgi:hypothetical protein